MELVEGKTLRELVASGEPLPTKKLLDFAVQIAEGLAKAHAAGIVHRDLKPENLMVSKDGFVKILDFGLAKLTETVSQAASVLPTAIAAPTQPGTVMGTAGYMSPEQASGQPVDYRSDQFTLGAILYEMATGRRAFQRKTGAETLVAIIREEPEPLGTARAESSGARALDRRALLAKDPEERYASTKDLARDLKSLRDHLTETSFSGGLGAAEPARAAAAAGSCPPLLALAARGGVSAILLRGIRRWGKPARRDRVPAVTFQRGQDPDRAVCSRRLDDRLQRRLGRPPARGFHDAPDSAESRSLGCRARRPLGLFDRRDCRLARTAISSSATRRRERSRGCARPAARRERSSRAPRTPTGRPTARSWR